MWQKTKIVAIIDTETTGVASFDEPISIGVLVLEIEAAKGTLISEIGSYYGRRYPSVAIHPCAQAVHGIDREDLIEQDIDIHKVNDLLDRAEVFIAHNSAFDARMMRVVVPEIAKMPWLCTSSGWPWPKLGDRKLDTICMHLGILRPEPHNALADCRALADALLRYSGKTVRSRTYLSLLLMKSPHTHEYDSRIRELKLPASEKPPTVVQDGGLIAMLWLMLAFAVAAALWFALR